VQHDVQWPLGVHHLAVDLHVVAVCGLCAEIAHDLAIDRHAPGGDQLIALPAGNDARRREESI